MNEDSGDRAATDAIGMPRWGKAAVVVAAILLFIVVLTSVDFGGSDEPERPNLIGFETTTTTTATTTTSR
jgi:hypothetical protein